MTITFTALDSDATHVGGNVRLRLRARGRSVEGVFGEARLRVRAVGTTDGSSVAPTPATPIYGSSALRVRTAGTSVTRQSVSGGTSILLRQFGYGVAPGSIGGRTRLSVRARGMAGMGGTAYALLVPQDPVVSAYGNVYFENSRDTFAASDAEQSGLILVVRALLAVSDAPTARADAAMALGDTLHLDDALYAVLLELINDGFTFDDTLSLDFRQIARAVSTLLLTGQVTTALEALATIADALAVGQLLRDYLLMQEGDTLSLDDTETLAAAYLEALLDSAAFADGLVYSYTGMALVSDALTFDDNAATEAELIAQLRDALALSVTLALDNGLHFAWALNTDSSGITTYDHYPFNSFAKIGGRYYGATSTGVYLLEGDTDDGTAIAARLRLGMSEMGTRLKKSYSEVYVGYTGNGQMLLRVIFTDDGSGQKLAAEYRMKPRPAAGRRESRFEPGKGLQAIYFDFELENINGADFDLSSVDFQPLISNRRTRG